MAPLRSVPGTEEAVSSAEDFGVRCQLCDELFRPDFYDRCHQCGYEFGDGLPSDSIEPDEVTARALIVTAALLGVFLLTVIYFGWIL
ncbi:MAG TPA: hypothetical protein DCY79_09020 [Planctomycetaceae bacterium]|nr:hypothetical protein [Blastopirellula sp.]HAY79931.1 hypothetical protein [Planctomycetaceae bacterium]|tara:strand:+ start:1028 stop:1288 length:261 start_codon:yes stop_codon:yes gene_type:complete